MNLEDLCQLTDSLFCSEGDLGLRLKKMMKKEGGGGGEGKKQIQPLLLSLPVGPRPTPPLKYWAATVQRNQLFGIPRRSHTLCHFYVLGQFHCLTECWLGYLASRCGLSRCRKQFKDIEQVKMYCTKMKTIYILFKQKISKYKILKKN